MHSDGGGGEHWTQRGNPMKENRTVASTSKSTNCKSTCTVRKIFLKLTFWLAVGDDFFFENKLSSTARICNDSVRRTTKFVVRCPDMKALPGHNDVSYWMRGHPPLFEEQEIVCRATCFDSNTIETDIQKSSVIKKN